MNLILRPKSREILRNSAGTARVHTALTTFAAGMNQAVDTRLAPFLFPLVRVGSGSYQFKIYDSANSFQNYDTRRAMGGKATRIEFAASDPTGVVKAHALEAVIDDQERKNSGDNGAGLERAKVSSLVTNFHLAREKRALAFVEANTTAASGKGVWSDAAVDPIAQIDEQIENITTATGMMPNRMAIGLSAWRVIKNHALVKARFATGSNENSNVSLPGFASLLLNPKMDIRVGVLSQSTTKFGATKAAANIVGAKVYIFNGSDAPSQEDPSWFKSFSTGDNNVAAVKFYREDPFADVFLVDMDDDMQLIAAACGARIDVS